jgi:hypothetical protein
MLAMLILHTNAEFLFNGPSSMIDNPFLTLMAMDLLCLSPGPLLLFLRLRGLAGRARSAHLAEHCRIVGVGASATALFAAIVLLFTNSFGRDYQQAALFNLATWTACVMTIAALLFALWAFYLLVRFAIAFRLASRNLQRTWARDDRSLTSPANPDGSG